MFEVKKCRMCGTKRFFVYEDKEKMQVRCMECGMFDGVMVQE